jgi:hypothetical protein
MILSLVLSRSSSGPYNLSHTLHSNWSWTNARESEHRLMHVTHYLNDQTSWLDNKTTEGAPWLRFAGAKARTNQEYSICRCEVC